MTPTEIPPRFDPAEVEARWQAEWERHDRFRAPPDPRGTAFSMVLPPPNVTGVLTLGHMLGDTVMDVLVRWHRMRGEPTLWVPGVDHAGLATQVEVRRRLAKEGVRLETLPREEILRHVNAWKTDREATIRAQTRAGGFSLDWSRYRYTMDPGSIRATREVFVALYRDGLVYRGERIVNWDPRLRTAVSDLEVVHREETSELLYINYPWADGSPGGIVVATVRPETIFGDVAVAVHPDDDRHRAAVGRSVWVPLTGRSVPVIPDAAIDPKFGNGALKLTPRHDPVDFEIARRHPEVEVPPSILDDGARLSGERVPEPFQGLDRDRARAAVRQALADGGFVVRSEAYSHSVGHSERSDAVIEPMLSKQWFVRMAGLAPPAVAAVEKGEIRIHPERWKLTFFRWMEHLEDWCISRQVAWGHAIPVYYCDTCGAEIASVDAPVACDHCSGVRLTPDPDVLDTWFTSWLWPFLALGWPEATEDLERYYPTSVLVTGRDIMFFWVARMMMAGFRFTGKRPFSDVYFTGMLRDETGRRMSKHLANSPDPLDVIRERGADALRFALLYPNPVDQDGPFGAATLDGGRNFLTKLWNLVRFALAHVPDGAGPPDRPPELRPSSSLEDRWILSKWRRTIRAVDDALQGFDLTGAAGLLHGFVWHDIADRYVETTKEALQGRRGDPARSQAREVLLFVLDRVLRALHPIVPHVTEELWHALPHAGESLAVARWPSSDEAPDDPEAESAMETVFDAVRAYRNLRSESGAAAAELPLAFVRPSGPAPAGIFAHEAETLRRLSRVERIELLADGARPRIPTVSAVTPAGEFFLARPVGAREDTEGLERERLKLSDLLDRTQGRLADAGFRSRAPASVVAETEEKARELKDRIRKIDEHLVNRAPGAA